MTFEEWWDKSGDGRSKMLAKRAWVEAANAEREACAKVCDDLHDTWKWGMNQTAIAALDRARQESACALT